MSGITCAQDSFTLIFIKLQSKLYLEGMTCGPYSRIQYSQEGNAVTPECGPYSRVQYSEAGTAVTPECGPYNTYSAHR